MPRKSKKVVATASPTTKTKVSRSRKAKPTPGAAETNTLSPAREQAITRAILALQDEELIQFPGRLKERVQWSAGIWVSATRDAAELSGAPFFDEPAMSPEEIATLRDQIEMLRLAQSRFMALRGKQKAARARFQVLAAEAAIHKETLLRTFTLRFRKDPGGLKRLASIRAGRGDADLVQDVSDLLGLCAGDEAYLARGKKGEAAAARRLAEMSPELVSLLGQKSRDEGSRAARRLRDGAYTLVQGTERRIRAAAEYWYGGTPKMKQYLAYVAPKGAKADPEDEVGDPAAPEASTTSPAVA